MPPTPPKPIPPRPKLTAEQQATNYLRTWTSGPADGKWGEAIRALVRLMTEK